MDAMSKAKPFIDALNGTHQAVPPIWLMRQAGRYLPEYRALRTKAKSFLDFCFTPDLATEATLQPIRRYGFDAAILFSDILVIPHALGQTVSFRQGVGPVLAAVCDARDVDALSVDGAADRLANVYETVRRVRRELPGGVGLIGFAGAPWTVATYMVEGGSSREFSRVKRWAYGDADGFARLIDKIIDATADYLCRQVEAGAEALQIFDSWAGVLPEDAFERWCVAATRRLVDRVRARHPAVPIIGFPRGAGLMHGFYARESGVTAIGLDTTVPPGWAAEHLQPLLPVQGNLDPQMLVTGGAAMAGAVDRIIQALGKGPFIFNLGHGIVPETPTEHVSELIRRVRMAGASQG
ncbi:MAG: uroporphyrinogen decarboxylase [Alphaproteobacteria bacterium]